MLNYAESGAEGDLVVLEWITRDGKVVAGEPLDLINAVLGYAPKPMLDQFREASFGRLVDDGLIVPVDPANARYSLTDEAIEMADRYRAADWEYDPELDRSEAAAIYRWASDIRAGR